MNRVGGERVLSLYWFVIFVIIAIGVVSGVLLFSKPVDVRDVEGNILADRVINCFVEKGKLKDVEVNRENFEGVCDLNFDDVNYKDEQYYVEVKIDKKVIKAGGDEPKFKPFCDRGEGESKKNIPLCVRKSLRVLDGGEEEKFVTVDVLVSIRKIQQNAIK